MYYAVIKDICKEKNISVSEVEKRAKLGNGTITKWNKSVPNLKNLEAVANVLGIKATTIIKRRDNYGG